MSHISSCCSQICRHVQDSLLAAAPPHSPCANMTCITYISHHRHQESRSKRLQKSAHSSHSSAGFVVLRYNIASPYQSGPPRLFRITWCSTHRKTGVSNIVLNQLRDADSQAGQADYQSSNECQDFPTLPLDTMEVRSVCCTRSIIDIGMNALHLPHRKLRKGSGFCFGVLHSLSS